MLLGFGALTSQDRLICPILHLSCLTPQIRLCFALLLDADLRQVDIVIADIAHNVTTCNIDQVFKSVYQLEGLALRLECPAEMIADMKGAERGQCYADTIYKMLKNYKRKCAERRDSEIGQKMVSLLVDNGYRALVAGGGEF